MDRQPIVAGQFYTGDPDRLKTELGQYVGKFPEKNGSYDRLVMLPHAGYVFSGRACGTTLEEARIADTVILLGPNHTGMGDGLSVWPGSGSWIFPGGRLDVDEAVARAIVDSETGFSFDRTAHVREHSLEVIVPFLHYLNPSTRIVPICVSESDPSILEKAGEALANVISESSVPVSMVVSSDMSHYISAEQAKKLDSMALENVVRVDPLGLYSTVSRNGITMCGVLPMTMALYAAKKLGSSSGRLVAYSNSGSVTGDMDQVVAYAGVIVS